jgi:2-polyprenyl-3-methyl-5-hydroxy-6-metoxy-1,4-benzoquinol methylase
MKKHLTSDYVHLQNINSGFSYNTPWGDLMEDAIINWFSKSILDKSARILDFACGEGRGLDALKNLGYTNLTGLDLNPEKCNLAEQRGHNIINGDIYSVLEMNFDYIFTSHTLEHTPSIRDTLHLLSLITNKEIFFIIPTRETLDFVKENNPSHVSPIDDPIEFLNIISSLNLNVDSVEVTRFCKELWGRIDCRNSRSDLRKNCDLFIKKSASLINKSQNLGKKLLYIGIAGDPIGGEYTSFFPNYTKITFDSIADYCPDIVGNISHTNFDNESWDLIICSNVIEHVPELFDAAKELTRILKVGGYLLIDSPWQYPYHGEPPNFGDYWRFSLEGLKKLIELTPTLELQTDISSHILFEK